MTPGSSIAHYRIAGKLGEGGMGEVWRATDTRLGRDVAIKVLPPALSGDSQYMARFEREAQTLAALNHPNIAAIYGVEQGAIVMELVEGETLPCPVPLDTALGYARQIADGLEAAHEKGIVHRDLKPANIRITPDGRVKILDFGLAKSAERAAATSATISPTLSLAMTQAGMILGTAAYMAPEQARGKPVDKRADIWAFGVVLYEMLTGKQLFGGGETITDTLASVVKDAPDLGALPADTPAHVRRLLERCLRKDPAKRLRDIGEARIAIDEPAAAPSPAAPARDRRPWIPWAVAALALVAAAAGWFRAARPVESRPLIRMEMPAGSLALSNGGALALSRDGTRFAIVGRDKDGKTRIYTRLMHQGQLAPVGGTEEAHTPFFSPDGRWIGFTARGKLQKVSVDGGPPIPLCDVPALRGASWGDDDTIVFAPSVTTGLLRIPAAGGAPTPLTALAPDERTHRWPHVLPGGAAVLFTSHTATLNYDDATIEAVAVKTGQRKVVRRGAYAAQYVTLPDGSGRLLYVNKNALYAVRFDPVALEVFGDASPVAQEIHTGPTAGASFAASSAGTFTHLLGSGNVGSLRVFWVDPGGRREPILESPSVYLMPRISPDGKRLAYAAATGSDFAIWVKDLDRDTASRLTFLPGVGQWPVWTPDGKHIVFRQNGVEAKGLYWIRADGGGQAMRLTDGGVAVYPLSFSPDGKRLAVSYDGPTKSLDIATVRVEGDPEHPTLGAFEPFVATPATEVQPVFSPDGRWLAYGSNESGIMEVYVRPFPGPGGHWQISSGGGNYPVWSRHGELFYESGDRIYVVPYTARGDTFANGKPAKWSDVVIPGVGTGSRWDVTPDGKRAVASLGVDDDQSSTMHLVFLLNFTDELLRRSR